MAAKGKQLFTKLKLKLRAPQMAAVLATPQPTLSGHDACIAALSVFGVEAGFAEPLGSERDQVFLLLQVSGKPLFIMKVSNVLQEAHLLDFEADAAKFASFHENCLPVALPLPCLYGSELKGQWGMHWCRLYKIMPGCQIDPVGPFDDQLFFMMGTGCAQLGQALRGFSHPSARRFNV